MNPVTHNKFRRNVFLSALLRLALVLLSGHLNIARAGEDVYLCADENGHKEYKNNGSTKGCHKVELPGLMTIPAPKFSAAKNSNSSNANTSGASGGEFPKVDTATQKARDNERLAILEDELKIEQQKLSDLKKEYNNGEPERRGDERNYAKYQERLATLKEGVSRSESNVEALKREIANLGK